MRAQNFIATFIDIEAANSYIIHSEPGEAKQEGRLTSCFNVSCQQSSANCFQNQKFPNSLANQLHCPPSFIIHQRALCYSSWAAWPVAITLQGLQVRASALLWHSQRDCCFLLSLMKSWIHKQHSVRIFFQQRCWRVYCILRHWKILSASADTRRALDTFVHNCRCQITFLLSLVLLSPLFPYFPVSLLNTWSKV